MNRWSDALAIQGGACNPKAIARTLVRAMDDPDLKGTDQIRNDPACRLMAHQLAFLFDVDGGLCMTFAEYERLVEECRSKAALQGESQAIKQTPGWDNVMKWIYGEEEK